ncbi:hypothetical protein Avbf_01797 [Armadillidium vulgare]|nr:hypothetical protein Avbf_01797 [Armadillidium vulgare]
MSGKLCWYFPSQVHFIEVNSNFCHGSINQDILAINRVDFMGFNQPTSSSSFGFGTNQSALSGGLNFGSTLGQQSNNTLGFGAGNQSSGGLFWT